MGYSESRKTLERIRPFLSELEKGLGTRWDLVDGVSATDFAYKMREGLYIATLYKEEYPELALAHATFRIERVDRRTVQAVFKNKTLNMRDATVVTVHGLDNAEKGPTTLMGQMDATRVIGAWHNMQPSNTPMHFPQAAMTKEELIKLYTWAEKRTPKWLLLVANDGSLTLQMWSRDMDGLGWDPSDE